MKKLYASLLFVAFDTVFIQHNVWIAYYVAGTKM